MYYAVPFVSVKPHTQTLLTVHSQSIIHTKHLSVTKIQENKRVFRIDHGFHWIQTKSNKGKIQNSFNKNR